MQPGVAFVSGCGGSPPAAPPLAPAPATPGADQIQFAAREHDLGYRAYLDKQYEEAASHFENAFFAAPNPAELRSAVRARRDAGELARAATLAAIGQRRFPDDAATNRVADEVIAQARPHVFEVRVSSSLEYNIAVDDRMVMAQRAREVRVFLNPGAHRLMVSWSEDRNMGIPIDGAEGGSASLQLEPPALAPAAPAPPEAPSPAPAPPDRRASALAAIAAPPRARPFGPAIFIAGAALTTVAAGFTVWSGIDTLNSPGKDAVLANCVGVGTGCSWYKEGRSAQLRTNLLLATTGIFAVATAVVGVFLTQWPRAPGTAGAFGVSRLDLAPTFRIGRGGVEGTF